MSISSKRFDGSSWNFANVFLLINGRHLRSFVATRNAALPPSGHFWNYFTVLLRSCPYLWNALTDLHEILHMCFYQWVDDTHEVLLEPGILLCHLVAIFETILRFFCIHVHTFETLWRIFMKFYAIGHKLDFKYQLQMCPQHCNSYAVQHIWSASTQCNSNPVQH